MITIDLNNMIVVGGNVKATIVDGMLVIVVDPSIELGLSSKGDKIAVANTNGHQGFPGGLRGQVWLGKPAK
jgi:hypothetical protein